LAKNRHWGQNGDNIAIALRCVDGLLAACEENRIMASLEKRGRSFRVVFRYQGIKYTKSLSTRSEKAAEAAFARLEDNLHRLELGTLEQPDEHELAGFLLGDQRAKPNVPTETPLPAEPETLTLAALFTTFWDKLPDGSLEQSTVTGMEIHQRQLEKHFHRDFLIGSLTLTQLQEYVERRSQDKGLHGRKVAATTIKKAIVTLRTVWNWGRQHGLIGKEFPSRGIKYPKGTQKQPFMTLAEVERRVCKAKPAKVRSSVPPRATGMPGTKEIVESQRSASNSSRSVPVASIVKCCSTTIAA
jgi:hypothetical protein